MGARRERSCWAAGIAVLAVAACGPEPLDPVEIAYVRRGHVEGSELRGRVPDGEDRALGPASADRQGLKDPLWSHDGTRLAFVDNRDDHSAVMVLDPETEEETKQGEGHMPRWSPARLELGFLERAGPLLWGLRIVSLEGEAARLVAPGHVREFDWAPDGERMVVVGAWPEPEDGEALHVLDVVTGEVVRIDPDPVGAGLWDGSPVWSPAGSEIAFVSRGRSEAEGEIYSSVHRMGVDGSGLVEVVTGLPFNEKPVWSPDGEALAVSTAIYDDTTGLADRVQLVGGGASLSATRTVAWSPDGTRVAAEEWGASGRTRTRVVVHDVEDTARWEPGPDPGYSEDSPTWRVVPDVSDG